MKQWMLISLVMAGCYVGFSVELPALFSDHMILQRDREIRIWGRGRVAEEIRVTFLDVQRKCTAGSDGRWLVTLPPLPATSRGSDLMIEGDQALTVRDVVVGDVWICAGQSNMDWYLDGITEAKKYLALTDQPLMRLLRVRHNWNRVPQADQPHRWQVSTRQSAENFSAVGWIAGYEIHRKTAVPVGLISIAVGGGRIEAFCAPDAFRKAAVSNAVAAKFEKDVREFHQRRDEELPKEMQRTPTVLFNAMVHPLMPFAVRGWIWYQGEENYADGATYSEKLQALAWTIRAGFREPNLPLFVVMLPPWDYHGDTTGRLPRLWMAQQSFVHHDRNADLVTATDCGDPHSVHPMSKETLALRLAGVILYREYGIGEPGSLAPVARRALWRNGAVEVQWERANGLKTRDGKAVSHLELAGRDGVFHPAVGRIAGETLFVNSPEVARPAMVRFGFDQLADPNLTNSAGVPAAPFELNVLSGGQSR